MTATATNAATAITTAELAEKLHGINGAAFVTLVIASPIKTLAKCRDTKQPTPAHIKGGTKTSTIFGIIGGRYANAVNNQRTRESIPADFVPQDHKWASYVDDSPVMQHNNSGELYLAIQRRPAKHTNKTVFTDSKGNVMKRKDIAGYLKDKPRETDGTHQGVDNPIQWLTLKLSNVTECRIGGEVFTIKQPAQMTMASLAARLGQTATN